MSILYSTEKGWIISHLQYIDKLYAKVQNRNESNFFYSLHFNKDLFNINSKFLRKNQLKNASDELSVSKSRKRKKLNLLPDDFLKEVRNSDLLIVIILFVLTMEILYIVFFFLPFFR